MTNLGSLLQGEMCKNGTNKHKVYDSVGMRISRIVWVIDLTSGSFILFAIWMKGKQVERVST